MSGLLPLNIPDQSWTTGDDVSASGKEGVTNDSFNDGTLASGLTSDYNDPREFV